MTILLAAVLIAAGILAIALGIAGRVRSQHISLTRMLDLERADPTQTPQAMVALMERAGALADRAMQGTTTTRKIQVALVTAGIKLRAGEFGIVAAAGGIAAGVLSLVLFGVPLLSIGLLILVPLLAYAFLLRKGRSRTRALEAQLPTVLQILAGSLDSGASMLHAMEIISQEGDAPLAGEFARVVAETQVGRPILDSLQALAERNDCQDLDWTVEAIRIQYTSGGSLSENLRVLAEFMRARGEVRAEVRALSAEARLSGKVLTGMPIAIGAYLFAFRRDYVAPMYTTNVGRVMLAIAIGGIILGSMWMRRIVNNVEV